MAKVNKSKFHEQLVPCAGFFRLRAVLIPLASFPDVLIEVSDSPVGDLPVLRRVYNLLDKSNLNRIPNAEFLQLVPGGPYPLRPG
jgi:hypothetical protein